MDDWPNPQPIMVLPADLRRTEGIAVTGSIHLADDTLIELEARLRMASTGPVYEVRVTRIMRNFLETEAAERTSEILRGI